MKITDKITTREELVQVIGHNRYEICYNELRGKIGLTHTLSAKVHWWAVREACRIATDAYETTEALAALNNHRQTFAHISSEDRNMVAFTPDAVFGAADRQLRISFGKLVARLIPFASDDYVRDLTAWHLADLSNEIEWIEGLAIPETYATDTSVGACMSNKRNFDVQPTIAYATAGVKMAVIRNSDNTLKARAMVVENDNKKVYIRCYGDPLLKRRLERLGYKVGTWEGVEFNTVFLESDLIPADQKRVAIPYLDGKNTTCSAEYSTVALIDNKLVCLTNTQQQRLTRIKPGHTKVPSTVGYVEVKNIESESFKVVDILTGKTVNALLHNLEDFVTVGEDGAAKFDKFDLDAYNAWMNSVDSDEEIPEIVRSKVFTGNEVKRVYVKAASTFRHRYDSYVDENTTREYLGYGKLSPTFYPDSASEWKLDLVTVKDDAGAEHKISRDDAVSVVMHDSLGVPVSVKKHKSAITKGVVRLNAFNGVKGFAHKDVKIYRTPSGTKVHPAHNKNIAETFEGYDFCRNVKAVETVLHQNVFVSKGTDLTRKDYVDHCNALFDMQFNHTVEITKGNFVKAAAKLLGMSGASRVYTTSRMQYLQRSAYYVDEMYNERIESVEEILTLFYNNNARTKWQRLAIKRLQAMLAEALAVEQPVRAEAPKLIDIDKPAKVVIATVDERFAIAA